MNHPMHEADRAARETALTALERTLLVEAGAGSGKTSVLAGRVAALLAAGRHPREIAAITFTELAAGELRQRVDEFVSELAHGHVRADLRSAFPETGPNPVQRANLGRAQLQLDELLCTTIHGFCQRLLRPWPVEAGMDPGAVVMDRADAEALLAEVLEKWLRERLAGPQQRDDLLLTLYVDDAYSTGILVRTLIDRMAHYRGASVPNVERRSDALAVLRLASAALSAFLAECGVVEPETADIDRELSALLAAAPAEDAPEADMLLATIRIEPPSCCATGGGAWKAYRKLGRWQAAAHASQSATHARQLHDTAKARYDSCRDAHAEAQSYAAGRVLQRLGTELRDVLARFECAKRDAALIDFDDLMVKTRDLLAGSPTVRSALAARYTAILVDEFQDTDRLQSEILWRLSAAAPDPAKTWSEWTLRPGALFLVGDPKQAVYRFRGADVASYMAMRDRLKIVDAEAHISITQNFRSLGPILEWVNERFATPLSADKQPGFSALFTTEAAGAHAAVATLPVAVKGDGASALRDSEAEAIASFCARVIGAFPVRGRDGPRPCRPDDIALLAPTGTELWRYERALERAGISVATQAGKGFFRRQEVQDLIALTRTLADGRDTLALGALLRGPLVGLTEEALLDATDALPPRDDGSRSRLNLWTPIEHIENILLRETLEILQTLAREANSTTPFALLCQAVEEFQIRPLLRRRQNRVAERALANVDQFLEAARAYDVRGLPAFAQSMAVQWQDAQRAMEGRPDTEEQSVSLVTMHAAKGLEWPIVIPINLGGGIKEQTHAALDADGKLHLPIFGFHGPGAAKALQAERDELERERHRLWYVATTRARDLLLLPHFDKEPPSNSYMTRFGLKHDGLDPFDLDALGDANLPSYPEPPNGQDRATFAREADLIAARTHRIRRVTPHLAEAGEQPENGSQPLPPGLEADAGELPVPRGSQARGLVLHKLLEEVLTGETDENASALASRTAELADQLTGLPGADTIDPAEAARTALAAIALPEIQIVRPQLFAEYAVLHSRQDDADEVVTYGIADAVTIRSDGDITGIIDWKSDVDPDPETIRHYKDQVRSYREAVSARNALIVFLTGSRTLPVS